MDDEIFSHRVRKFREVTGFSREDTGRLLGVTGHYIGMLERGEKDVEPHTSLAKLFALLEANKVHPSEFEPRSSHNAPPASGRREDVAPYHATPRQRGLSPSDVLSQIKSDVDTLEHGTHADKRRALLFMRDVHLPALAAALKIDL